MVVALPGELTDRIIDYLHNDSKALKMCSLTCKTWLPSSRHHLFSTVHVNTNLARFLSIVDVPWNTLGPAVRHLVLRHVEYSFSDIPSDLLPSCLPYVKTLEFSRVAIDDHPSFKNMLLRLDLEALVISDTTITGCVELVHIICAYPNLKRLTLFDLFWRGPSPRSGLTIETPRRQLSLTMPKLQISANPQCILFGQWLLDHCQPLWIRSLEFDPQKYLLPLFRQFLCSSGPSIKDMLISLRDPVEQYPEGHLPDTINLTPCINLHSLTIHATKFERGASWPKLPLVQAIISSISSSHFEIFYLVMRLSDAIFPNFANIPKLLARSTNLKKITIFVDAPPGGHDLLEESIRNEFSVFNALGILDVGVFKCLPTFLWADWAVRS